MKTRLTFILLIALAHTPVHAQSKGVGVGPILGEPTGLSTKVWISEHNALTGHWFFWNDGSPQIQPDYLIHRDLTEEIDQDLCGCIYLNYVIGGRVRDDTSDNRLSARVPLGTTYASGKSSLDVFIEIVSMLDFAPETAFDLNAAVGVRFYFNPPGE